MIRRDVEGRTSIAFCGSLTGRRVAPADPIRRRSGRDRNDDIGRDGCPCALDLRRVVGCDDRRAVASAVRYPGRWSRSCSGWAGLPGPVRACYEAGLTGFGLYRAAAAAGIDCQVIAPSKTPRRSGDRNKSDRRDTDLVLRPLMAGALTPVAVPSASLEAARDLARAREQVRLDLRRCRDRLSKLLLRHGQVWDRTAWTKVHRQWLQAQRFEHQNTELAFIDNLAACDGLTARKDALDERLSWVAGPGSSGRWSAGCARFAGSTRSRR